MTLKNRLAQLEKHQPAQVNNYLCIIHPDHEAEGYNVSDMQGGNGQHFATLAELEAFEARPDVDLLTIRIEYASKIQQVNNDALHNPA